MHYFKLHTSSCVSSLLPQSREWIMKMCFPVELERNVLFRKFFKSNPARNVCRLNYAVMMEKNYEERNNTMEQNYTMKLIEFGLIEGKFGSKISYKFKATSN